MRKNNSCKGVSSQLEIAVIGKEFLYDRSIDTVYYEIKVNTNLYMSFYHI